MFAIQILALAFSQTEATQPAPAAVAETVRILRQAWVPLGEWLRENRNVKVDRGCDHRPPKIEWHSCSFISLDELEKLVVPNYILRLPRKDAWNHDLEYCLERDQIEGKPFLIGVRSPGSDGAFDSDSYEFGTFPAQDTTSDIVLLDGCYYRQPEPWY